MENKRPIRQLFCRFLTYVLVAALASGITFGICEYGGFSKLQSLEKLITECFVGEVDKTKLEDAAADAMVKATGDRWSYYIPASQYQAHMEQMNNAYVGIGITISSKVGENGTEILQVNPDGGAHAAGIKAGDILVSVAGKNVVEVGMDTISEVIRGEEGSQVEVGVLRGQEQLTFKVKRSTIKVTVAEGKMLQDNIGLVRIVNFDDRCAEETLAAIEELTKQGAKALVFDVRFNPGGYKHELVKVLDYLLPEGTIFHSVTYDGKEEKTQSDAACLDLPMAVLVNGNSYSAAEFFAAALEEYDKAVIVGEPTVGKSYFQNTFKLPDGSAVGLSVGKYYTPKGVSLADVGGLVPEVKIELTDEQETKLYAGILEPEQDPHIQAAVDALKQAG